MKSFCSTFAGAFPDCAPQNGASSLGCASDKPWWNLDMKVGGTLRRMYTIGRRQPGTFNAQSPSSSYEGLLDNENRGSTLRDNRSERSGCTLEPARGLRKYVREPGLKGPTRRSLRLNASRADSSDSTETEAELKGPSAQSHLDVLKQLTSDSSPSSTGKTIAQQLAEELAMEEAEEISVPLGSNKLEMAPLTISQKRNIRRQNYLNEVSKRNDVPFFTAVFLFVIVPPAAILGVAVLTGYVDLFP